MVHLGHRPRAIPDAVHPFDEPISHGGRRQRRDVAADLREFGPPARRRQPDAVQVTIDVRFKVQRTAGKLFRNRGLALIWSQNASRSRSKA